MVCCLSATLKCPCLSSYLSSHLYTGSLFFSHHVYLFASLALCLSVCLSVCLTDFLSVCSCVCSASDSLRCPHVRCSSFVAGSKSSQATSFGTSPAVLCSTKGRALACQALYHYCSSRWGRGLVALPCQRHWSLIPRFQMSMLMSW